MCCGIAPGCNPHLASVAAAMPLRARLNKCLEINPSDFAVGAKGDHLNNTTSAELQQKIVRRCAANFIRAKKLK